MALLANALTTVDQVKQFYPTIETNFTDPDVEFLVNSISGFIEKFCNRKFYKQQKVETLTGNCKRKQMLKQYPILTVVEALLDGVDIATAINSETSEDELTEGFIYYDEGFISQRRGFKVTYEHGYITRPVAATVPEITLPYDLENLCIRIISNLADDILSQNGNIDAGGSTSAKKLKGFSITDVKWSFGNNASTSGTVRGYEKNIASYLTTGDRALLEQYREIVI